MGEIQKMLEKMTAEELLEFMIGIAKLSECSRIGEDLELHEQCEEMLRAVKAMFVVN